MPERRTTYLESRHTLERQQTLIKMKLEQVNLFVLGKESTPSIPRQRIF